jgi:glycosyltransferase involved in cell wall biosynthesis
LVPDISTTRPNGIRYALITPVRDEEKYIGAMIDSMLAQEIRPAKWIIVDDGSTDSTAEIVASYVRNFSLVELVQLPPRRERKAGGEGAIDQALRGLNLAEFDFLARFDADLIFAPDYIGKILSEFDRDPKLGIAGGSLYIEKDGRLELEKEPEYHVRGALKMYRRQCFEQIGELTTGIGWDTIDEVEAWTKGWKTRSFSEYRVIHRRPTGGGIQASRVYWERGKAEYYTWSHPLFVLAKTVKNAIENFSVLIPVCYLAGFISRYLARDSRIQDRAFAKARREEQRRRVALLRWLRRRPADCAAPSCPSTHA